MAEHKHKCECRHEHIRYCNKCCKPYCVDCGQEWELPNTWQYYPYYPWYEPYKVTWTSADAQTIDAPMSPDYVYSTTTCQHS